MLPLLNFATNKFAFYSVQSDKCYFPANQLEVKDDLVDICVLKVVWRGLTSTLVPLKQTVTWPFARIETLCYKWTQSLCK